MKIINGKDDFFELIKADGGKFRVSNTEDAYKFCEKIAVNHYENFPVGSLLIPKKHRKYFYSVYAFARLADDIADELTEYAEKDRIDALNQLARLAEMSFLDDKSIQNPIFMSLSDTIKQRNIPVEPFLKLIEAFKSDVIFNQPYTHDDNINYCKNSANPIGELVLRITENYNPENAEYSDAICTGLQLVNFWQDISTDYKIGRIYIPEMFLNKYNLKSNNILNYYNNKSFNSCLTEIYDYTENFFSFGKNLINCLTGMRLKLEISLTIEGGLKILEKLRKLGPVIVNQKPEINKKDFGIILINVFKRHNFLRNGSNNKSTFGNS
jgi:squalene synthase HpnC